MIGWALRLWGLSAFACALTVASAHASAEAGSAPSARIAPSAPAAVTASSGPPPWRAVSAIVGRELLEWGDPRTGSASRLNSSCGLILEAHLSGTSKQNYLNLSALNAGESAVDFRFNGVTAHFGSGLTRQLSRRIEVSHAGPGPHSYWLHRSFGFPSKAEFEHEDRLRIEVAIEIRDQGLCNASIELVRRSDVKVPESSYATYSRGQVNMGLNLHFASTGDLRTIASNVNPGFDFGWIAFPWVHHGIGLEFGVDAYGRRGLPAVAPAADANAVVGWFTMLTYSYRIQLSQRLIPQYDFGAGLYGLSVDSAEGEDRLAATTCLSLREKLKLNILLSTSPDGTRVALAPALIHSYIPAGHFGETSVSGNLFSGALYLVLE